MDFLLKMIASVKLLKFKFLLLSHLNARGVKPNDTASDIKKAYHKAALKHHPDKVRVFLCPHYS